jgi:hypothetical protein
MESHRYELSKREWITFLGGPLAVVALFVLATHGASWLGIFSKAAPSPFVDDIVVEEKKNAAKRVRDVDLLFVGDSSCLMGFSATAFEEMTPATRVYNLGTLSTLGLEKFTEFSERFLETNRTVQTVVLLITPEMVRSGSEVIAEPKKLSAEMEREFQALRAESERVKGDLERDRARDFAQALAIPFIKTQMVARVFEQPFPGSFGMEYGFPEGLRERLRRERGSAIDPTDREMAHVVPRGGGTPRAVVSQAFKAHCEAMRSAIPSGVRLLVGLTPIPEGGRGYEDSFRETLEVLQKYLRADGILTNLPATLPGHYFSSSTHLNAEGARQYTHALVRALRGETRMIAARKLERKNAQRIAQGGTAGAESGEAKSSP